MLWAEIKAEQPVEVKYFHFQEFHTLKDNFSLMPNLQPCNFLAK